MKRKLSLLILALLTISGCGSSSRGTSSSELSSSATSSGASSQSSEVSSESFSSSEPSSEISSESESISSEEISESSESITESSYEEHSSSEDTSSLESISDSESESESISSEESLSSEETSSSESFSEEESSSEFSSEESTSEFSSSEEIPTYDPANYYDGYYAGITSWENGEDLKEQLYTLLHNENYHPINYNKPNWVSNKLADKSLMDFAFVDGVYATQDIDMERTQRGWQREHAFPASLMTGSPTSDAVKFLGRATDFHNLFASDASGNSSRGNKNYGYADKTSGSYQDRTTGDGYNGYSFDEKTFEPATYDKGRLSRAIFYMATMYSKDEYDTVNNIEMKALTIVEENVDYVAGNNCKFAIGHFSDLLEWSEYPVDFLEMQHNQSVYADVIKIHTDEANNVAQGNRNPYVDYPDLVEYVFGDKKDEPGELKYIEPAYLKLNMDEDEIHHYSIEYAQREYSYGDTLTSEDYSIVAVKNDHSFVKVTEGVINNLENHTFTADDGENMTVTVDVGDETLTYEVSLNPMNSCSYNTGVLNKEGLYPNKTNAVTYNEEPFDIDIQGGSGLAISNDNQAGGFSMGSGTSGKNLSKVTITSKNEYTFNKAYIKCRAGNNSSTFTLTVKVGETTVLSNIRVTANNGLYAIYGGHFEEATGAITFILSGTNALRIHSFAFNVSE